MTSSGSHLGRVGNGICAVVLSLFATLLLVPATAGAASPVLEFVTPGGVLPVGFTAEGGPVVAEMADFAPVVHCAAIRGEGEITGPRSTVSSYRLTGCATQNGPDAECKSAGAEPEEITAGPVEGQLVYLDQATHSVGMLLNPGGAPYIAFECGSQSAEGVGRFLAPVGPVDTQASVFTATLSELDTLQTPDEYEGAAGELLSAIPEGYRGGSEQLSTTGVDATLTVHPSAPLEIKAMSKEEVEAREREATQRGPEQHGPDTTAITAQHHPEEAPATHAQPPRFSVLESKVVHGRLLLTLKVSTTGVLTVSGPGLRKTSKTLAAGVRRVAVTIVARSAVRTHRRTKVTIRLHAASGSVSRVLTVKL